MSPQRVEQVKGITYSLEAFLGSLAYDEDEQNPEKIHFEVLADSDEEFAKVNNISYSLGTLMGEDEEQKKLSVHQLKDASMKFEDLKEREILQIRRSAEKIRRDISTLTADSHHPVPGHMLHFIVIYLAPGDYHRFHSPTNWVVESRRHFAGELFSVSPYIAKRIRNLFVLNERVVLLGRWRYGFFSMIPVGATNVGSIRINFDKDLRTNSLSRTRPRGITYTEASYANSSQLLNGHPLAAGDEVGQFSLGSTVVLVFEAPKEFAFKVKNGQRIKVGEAIGSIPDESEHHH